MKHHEWTNTTERKEGQRVKKVPVVIMNQLWGKGFKGCEVDKEGSKETLIARVGYRLPSDGTHWAEALPRYRYSTVVFSCWPWFKVMDNRSLHWAGGLTAARLNTARACQATLNRDLCQLNNNWVHYLRCSQRASWKSDKVVVSDTSLLKWLIYVFWYCCKSLEGDRSIK